jgi:hypothetical protein
LAPLGNVHVYCTNQDETPAAILVSTASTLAESVGCVGHGSMLLSAALISGDVLQRVIDEMDAVEADRNAEWPTVKSLVTHHRVTYQE